MTYGVKKGFAPSPRESGAALISVVLIVGLLALLVTTVTIYVNSRATIVTMKRDELHKRLLLESALAYGVARVLSSPPGMPVKGDDRIRLTIGRAAISWTGESGRLDINFATPDRLVAMFVGAGMARDPALAIVNQIVMRRSLTPDAPLPNAFKAMSGKRLGPFEHVIELLTIPGMTVDLYARIEPLVTVYGLENKIDPRLAKKALISSLISMSSVDLARLDSMRIAKDDEIGAFIASIPESSSLFSLQRANATRLEILLQTTLGAEHRFEIVFLTFEDDNVPYRILECHEK